MIVFKYKREGKVIRPVAEVYLKSSENSWILFHPYIDSGADITMIPLTLGKLLGLQIEKNTPEQIGGIRGSVPVLYRKVGMRIGAEEFITTIAWALVEDIPALLGRQDVFDSFTITFKQKEGSIMFDPY